MIISFPNYNKLWLNKTLITSHIVFNLLICIISRKYFQCFRSFYYVSCVSRSRIRIWIESGFDWLYAKCPLDFALTIVFRKKLYPSWLLIWFVIFPISFPHLYSFKIIPKFWRFDLSQTKIEKLGAFLLWIKC